MNRKTLKKQLEELSWYELMTSQPLVDMYIEHIKNEPVPDGRYQSPGNRGLIFGVGPASSLKRCSCSSDDEPSYYYDDSRGGGSNPSFRGNPSGKCNIRSHETVLKTCNYACAPLANR